MPRTPASKSPKSKATDPDLSVTPASSQTAEDDPYIGYRTWPRDPHGPVLTDENTPKGIRTPNGQPWAPSPADFYSIELKPGFSSSKVWSLSMLHSLGEKHGDQDGRFEDSARPFEARPTVYKPFPLLKSSQDMGRDAGEDEGMTQAAFDGHSPRSETEREFEDETIRLPGAPNCKGLPPKLEQPIPTAWFPDILLVDDLCKCATGNQGQGSHKKSPEFTQIKLRPYVKSTVYKYVRQRPFIRDITRTNVNELNIASIHLSPQNLKGTGHHSSVYKAILRLPSPLTTNSRSKTGEVTVVAKLAFDGFEYDNDYNIVSDRTSLEAEASVLDDLTTRYPFLQDDWSGYNYYDGFEHPAPVGAVLAKMYGYYVPSAEALSKEGNLSPILLMEDCGEPVKPRKMSIADKCVIALLRLSWSFLQPPRPPLFRSLCPPVPSSNCCFIHRREVLSKFLALKSCHVLHSSAYARNMLVQPGPLTVPPSERSLRTPHFRLIDLGRIRTPETSLAISCGIKYQHRDSLDAVVRERVKWRSWEDDCRYRIGRAKEELLWED